jgi:hypothetical protein
MRKRERARGPLASGFAMAMISERGKAPRVEGA